MTESNELKLSNVSYWIIIVASTLVTLMYFQNFLKAFFIAIIIWYVVKRLRDMVGKIRIGKFRAPKWLVTIISTATVFLLIYIMSSIISTNFQKLSVDLPKYSDNITHSLNGIEKYTGEIDLDENIGHFLRQYKTNIAGYAGSFAGAVGQFLIILLYVIFILLEESMFERKIDKVLDATNSGENIHKTIKAIASLFDGYLSVKAFTSFITAMLSFFALKFIGVELAALWAFLIFIFNFIPSIGSVIATLFPTLFAMLQFGDNQIGLTVLAVVGGIQVFVGNVIEPKIMGDRLNISPLVVILGLTLWGYLWGIVGMILSVPITATLIILFAQFDNTKPLAIFLSKNGEIELGEKS
jgi:predicted PurR-regulated permease PerM